MNTPSFVKHTYWLVATASWTLIIAGLCTYAIMQSKTSITKNALIEANANIDKDIAYRKWVAEKGGVYVPASKSTPPNPYLNVRRRDVLTTDGVKLTLVNPAYMTRQVHELSEKHYGIKGHLTSLKPIHPGNKPDSWEESALREMEKGPKEVVKKVDINGKPHLRAMRAFVTEKTCLKCHAFQGHVEGDILGGISVSVPLEKYYAIYKADRNGTLIRYGVILILGLSGLLFLKRSLDKNSISLRESKERFRKLALEQSVILEASPAGICMLQNRVVQMANTPFDTLLRYNRGETLGKSTLEFFPDQETFDLIGAEAYSTIARGLSYSTSVRMRRKDGTLFWAELRGHAVPPGAPDDGAIWIIQDISQRKMLEEQITQDAARLESLLRISQFNYSSVQDLLDYALHEAISLTESRIGYIYLYSEKARQFTLNTWSKEVMNECRIVEPATIYALDDTGLWGEAVRQRKPILVNKFTAPNPLKKGFPEGHAPLHSFLTIPVFNKESIVAVVGVANKQDDYTEADVRQLSLMMEFVLKMMDQARVEIELKTSEKRYRELLESIHLLATILDIEGNITFCNSYFLKVTGFTHEEAIGLNVPDKLVPKSEQDAVRAAYLSVIAGKVDGHGENHIVTKNGGSRLIVWNRVPVIDANGNVSGIASIGIDITDHRSLEEQLRHSQKMEAIGQLAGGVAHDFNNILTVIQGYSELLKRSKNLDAHEREQVEEIFTSAERAAQLTHGLLAFSRKQALVMKHNNLNDIVQGVHKFLARTIGEDVTFQTTCSGPELPVIADKAQLEQVLINLATNARDAMSNGGSFTIKSELSVLDLPFMDIVNYSVPPGKYALLTVSDTGAGIKKEHLNHIFEPFFTTKEVGKGTGLGMAIIYGIIKQHNGFINVCSKVGEGTTIQIYLPIVEESDKPKPVSTTEVVIPAKGHETILVAEDEPAVRTLVAEVLTSVGYQVIVAEDGVDAITKFKQHQDKIGLILMDMIMPRKSGWEAYEDIQRLESGIKVIFTSGYTADFIENRGLSEEGIDLIMKPVKPNELLNKVREAFNN